MKIKSGVKVRVIGNQISGCHPIGFVGVVGQTCESMCRVEHEGYTKNDLRNWYRYYDLEVVTDDYFKVRVTEDVSGWPIGFVGWYDPKGRAIWNSDFSDYRCHTLGNSCELVDESDTGTLEELNVKPGDVVEYIRGGSNAPQSEGNGQTGVVGHQLGVFINGYGSFSYSYDAVFRIISRAHNNPKTWGEMTDEEKGALLLAAHEGKEIQMHTSEGWYTFQMGVEWDNACSYRVRPEPVRETLTLYGCPGSAFFLFPRTASDTHRITFDMVDGKPDVDTIKMEEL